MDDNDDEEKDCSFSTSIIEAFVLLNLKNNYFAWVCDFWAKMNGTKDGIYQLKTKYNNILDDADNKSLSKVFPLAFEAIEYKLMFPHENESSTCDGDEDDLNDVFKNTADTKFEVYSKVTNNIKYAREKEIRKKIHRLVSLEAMRL